MPATTQAESALQGGLLEMMFASGPVVQLVLFVLIAFSVISWAIIFSKWGATQRSFRQTDRFLDVFWSGKSMDFIYAEAKKLLGSPVAKIFQSGYVELQRLVDKERQKKQEAAQDPAQFVPPENSIHNLERALRKASRTELLRLERSLPFLATAGSTAPFIGLFGTVWGILNAFKNIGLEGGASLVVVAPGIAEALVATAIGLAAAIPAVMGYNFYMQKIRSMKANMDGFSEDFLNIVKRNFLAN